MQASQIPISRPSGIPRGTASDSLLDSLSEVSTMSPNTCPPCLRSEQREGAGNAGCALHPRSRVQDSASRRTRAYRFSGNTPASPAQWLYGLWRALLGDEFLL